MNISIVVAIVLQVGLSSSPPPNDQKVKESGMTVNYRAIANYPQQANFHVTTKYDGVLGPYITLCSTITDNSFFNGLRAVISEGTFIAEGSYISLRYSTHEGVVETVPATYWKGIDDSGWCANIPTMKSLKSIDIVTYKGEILESIVCEQSLESIVIDSVSLDNSKLLVKSFPIGSSYKVYSFVDGKKFGIPTGFKTLNVAEHEELQITMLEKKVIKIAIDVSLGANCHRYNLVKKRKAWKHSPSAFVLVNQVLFAMEPPERPLWRINTGPNAK